MDSEYVRALFAREPGFATPKVNVRVAVPTTAGYCSSVSPRTGLSLTRVAPAQVKRLLEHHRQPELATDFE